MFQVSATMPEKEENDEEAKPISKNQQKKLDKEKKKKEAAGETPAAEENKAEVAVPEESKAKDKKEFFGKPTFLTVSGQLSVENYACAVGDVYTFGPTFRAENSHTSRHLAEFWMIEPEIAFANLEDVMDLTEDYVKYCLRYVLENNKDDIEYFNAWVSKGLVERLTNVVEKEVTRITYTDAIDLLWNHV